LSVYVCIIVCSLLDNTTSCCELFTLTFL
jgi:hypothetical protein